MNSRMEIGHALKRLMNDQQMIKSNLLLVQAGQDEGNHQICSVGLTTQMFCSVCLPQAPIVLQNEETLSYLV